MNEDAMATEKLSEGLKNKLVQKQSNFHPKSQFWNKIFNFLRHLGIRNFAKDGKKLKDFVSDFLKKQYPE